MTSLCRPFYLDFTVSNNQYIKSRDTYFGCPVVKTHWGQDKMAVISQAFTNAISWMKTFEFQITFHWSMFPKVHSHLNQSWASYQIRKIAGAHAPGMPGTFSPPPCVSDPDMHHVMCVTHVPWCKPGSLTGGFLWGRRWGKTFPAFPAHAQHAILRIW